MPAFATALTILRLSRIRYLALTVPPFVVGATEGSNDDGSYLLLGIGAIVLLRGISSIGNCVSDRIEDALDHPQRVTLCERVGYHRLHSLTNWLVLTYVAVIAIMALTCDLHFGAFVLWISFLLIKWSYSFGPRLKPMRLSATVLLGGVSGGMFFVGWVGTGASDIAPALSGGLLLWAMGANLIGSKDAPNIEGDEAAGYRSVYRDLIERPRPFVRATAVLSRPYVLAVVLALATLSEGPGWRMLWCWGAFPLAIGLAWAMTHAETPAERSYVREFGYLYWIAFMGAVLVSVAPGATSLGAAVGALGWYLLTSRLLHPDPTPRVSALLRDFDHGTT